MHRELVQYAIQIVSRLCHDHSRFGILSVCRGPPGGAGFERVRHTIDSWMKDEESWYCLDEKEDDRSSAKIRLAFCSASSPILQIRVQ